MLPLSNPPGEALHKGAPELLQHVPQLPQSMAISLFHILGEVPTIPHLFPSKPNHQDCFCDSARLPLLSAARRNSGLDLTPIRRRLSLHPIHDAILAMASSPRASHRYLAFACQSPICKANNVASMSRHQSELRPKDVQVDGSVERQKI
jgi:hypothetical protein